MGKLKLQSHGTLYSNKVIGTLAAATFGTARKDLNGLRSHQVLFLLY